MTPKKERGHLSKLTGQETQVQRFSSVWLVVWGFLFAFFGFDILVFLKKKFLFLGLNNTLSI